MSGDATRVHCCPAGPTIQPQLSSNATCSSKLCLKFWPRSSGPEPIPKMAASHIALVNVALLLAIASKKFDLSVETNISCSRGTIAVAPLYRPRCELIKRINPLSALLAPSFCRQSRSRIPALRRSSRSPRTETPSICRKPLQSGPTFRPIEAFWFSCLWQGSAEGSMSSRWLAMGDLLVVEQ